jgi:hypothetical protein
MDRFDDDTMLAELREIRPTPRPEFTAELDERAAAGFPRGERASATARPFARLADRWKGKSPRRRLVPILAVAAVVVATVVVAISQSGGGNASKTHATNQVASAPQVTESSAGGAEEIGGGGGGGLAGRTHKGEKEAGKKAQEVEHSEGGVELAEPEAELAEETGESYIQAQQHLPDVEVVGGAARRDIERSAYIVLGTKPGEVSGAAAKVYEAVHAANGVVLHSSVQSGNAGATGASFDLLIPSAKLDDALATFSSIAEVRQRHDATNDITAPTVSAAEELADSNAAIEGLLKELGNVETEAERESVETRLREERRHHASIRASLDHLHKRASMSEVTVRIVTGHGAGVTPPSKGGGSWGVVDALHDAGQVLAIAAGVVLIGLSVLAPFALIALLLWAANRFRIRRLRERTLG